MYASIEGISNTKNIIDKYDLQIQNLNNKFDTVVKEYISYQAELSPLFTEREGLRWEVLELKNLRERDKVQQMLQNETSKKRINALETELRKKVYEADTAVEKLIEL